MRFRKFLLQGERHQCGFSVLELLIALGLLGTLLALAWSILGSYRSAQQRGWDQSYRLQVAAAVREMLENDVLHWSPPATSSNSMSIWMSDEFQGTGSGFTVTMVTSLDPVPWLEQVLSGQSPADQLLDASDLYDRREEPQSHSLLLGPSPLESIIRLSYELRLENSTSDDRVFRLVRSMQPLGPANSQTDNASEGVADADRLLSLADLYRQTDDDTHQHAPVTVTHNLHGLAAATFRYFDGKEWRGEWDSTFQAGFPNVIEFSFDHPAARNPDAPQPIIDDDLVSASDSLTVAEPTLESGSEASVADRDVRIVLLVPGGGRL